MKRNVRFHIISNTLLNNPENINLRLDFFHDSFVEISGPVIGRV